MTTPPEDDAVLIPRPELTPGALREALSVVAPGRLPDMDREKDEALAEAVRCSTLGPLRAFLSRWAALVEIERVPATAQAFHRAEHLAHVSADPAVSRDHAREASRILRAAYRELGS